MSDELLDALRRFADTELDQWEAFTFGSEYGPVYVTISRQPDPDGRHYDPADDLDVASEHFAAGRPVAELDDDDNVVLRWSDGTVERVDEPDAIERLRSRIDSDPDRRAQVEQLKDQMRHDADVRRAIDRLRRVARDMATNSDEAERAGLAGDARRWWTVRGSVMAALEMLGAPLPRPTVTVDVTPADLAAEEVRVHQAQLQGDEPLRVGDAVWVSAGDGTTWEGTVRARAADDAEVWHIRLWVGRHQRGGGGDA